MKKGLIALALAAALGVTACGGGGAVGTTAGSGEPAASSASEMADILGPAVVQQFCDDIELIGEHRSYVEFRMRFLQENPAQETVTADEAWDELRSRC